MRFVRSCRRLHASIHPFTAARRPSRKPSPFPDISQDGVRRYGFHGISYEYITSRLAEVAPEIARRRLVIAHLGNGASLCAVHEARSVASTMGFTAADGLMMGTRCGSLDPGVMIYLMDRYGLDARGLEDLIYRRSGLLGVSGLSSDMRALRASKEPAAREAVALFVYRIVREIGSLAAALGGHRRDRFHWRHWRERCAPFGPRSSTVRAGRGRSSIRRATRRAKDLGLASSIRPSRSGSSQPTRSG